MEELKLILETVGQATGAAKQFGIFWLSIYAVKVLGGYVLGGGAVYGAYRLGKMGIAIAIDHSFATSLRGIVCPSQNYGSLTIAEKDRIVEAVKKGMDKPT